MSDFDSFSIINDSGYADIVSLSELVPVLKNVEMRGIMYSISEWSWCSNDGRVEKGAIYLCIGRYCK